MSLITDERPVWSRTQMSALRECARKFVFSKRSVDALPHEASAAALRKMKNRYLWSGSVVHDAVASVVKAVRQGEAAPDVPVLLEKTRETMRAAFKASREGSGERLFEHEYNIVVSPDAWKRQWEQVENSLTWFLQSKWLARLKSVGPECWKAVDEILSFDVNGIKAFAKINCAIEANGRVCVINWKTSAPTASSEPSLLVAALYAHETWGAEPDAIDAVAVSLLDGKAFHAAVNEETLMETHLRIEEESALLAEASSNAGSDPFALPVATDAALCARCSFQRLCFPSGLVSPR